MAQFAEYTSQAREAIEKGDMSTLADLMDANFEFDSSSIPLLPITCSLRHRVYGEAGVGAANLKMIELARKCGAVCAHRVSASPHAS